jgi:hypothetical protein
MKKSCFSYLSNYFKKYIEKQRKIRIIKIFTDGIHYDFFLAENKTKNVKI